MQCNGEATGERLLDDNMAEGDLGDGMDKRLAALDLQAKGHQEHGTPSGTELPRESRVSDAGFSLTSFGMPYTSLKTRSGSLLDLSKEELRERLQEASETLEVLRCELEVTHRYLEGKYEALKILQGKTILDKATTHTKSLLQKSEDRAKALEKEVNNLQWEITFNQVQMKKFEQAWEQKFNRMNSENKALSKSLEERLNESRELKAENTGLTQQCVELLSMLSVKEQKAYEGTKPPCSHGRDGTVLEMAVLGACRCPGVMESCPCAKTAAASRTQLLQLRQELDLLLKSREEALLMADAFRIAFEQQLRKRSDHLLLQAEARTPKSHPSETQGKTLVGVAQRLRAILPSGLEAKASLEHTDTLQKLLDLLNDKEEALAHQRKVSHMLAHHAKELQKQLPVEATWPLASQTKPLESFNFTPPSLGNSQFKTSSRLSKSDLKNKRHQLHNSKISPQGTQDSQNLKEVSLDSKAQVLDSPVTKTPTGAPLDTKTPTGEPPVTKTPTGDPPDTKTPTREPPDTKTPTGAPPDTKTPTGEPPVTKTPTGDPPDTKTPTREPPDTKTPTGDPPDTRCQPPDARTQPEEPLNSKIQPDELPETNTLLIEPPDIETLRNHQMPALSYQNHETPAATRTT
ncbi:unnamed protein product [Lota lota]